MSSDQDFDRIVHDWLEVGPTELSDRVTEAARLGIGRTKQRGVLGRVLRWPASRSGRLIATGGAVILVVAGVFGFRLLQDRPAIGGPEPTPGATTATTAPSASAQVPQRLQVSFHVRATPEASPDEAAMRTIRGIVLQRLQAAGFADPVVMTGDRNVLVVDLPYDTDWRPVRTLLEQRGVVTFVPLPPDAYGRVSTGGPTDVAEGQPLPVDEHLQPLFTGAAITAANPTSDESGSPAVEFTLDAAASKLFADYTAKHVGEFFAIALDGTVVSIPSIRSPISGGSGIITLGDGADASTRASELASFLRIGALPYKLDWAGNGTSSEPPPSPRP